MTREEGAFLFPGKVFGSGAPKVKSEPVMDKKCFDVLLGSVVNLRVIKRWC